jgi:cobalt-zinc-cadmium efflux system membrane fusion protein
VDRLNFLQHLRPPHRGRRGLIFIGVAIVVFGALAVGVTKARRSDKLAEEPAVGKHIGDRFYPTPEQWATLTIAPVQQRVFRSQHTTEGKIAVNEDQSTSIFSPYSGRITKLLAKPGDIVQRGQPLFIIEATDTIQAQNDFIAAVAAVNKAQSQVHLAEIVEKRQQELYVGKAVALKEWQQAQADLTSAQSDQRSADTALEAARNRLRILGRSEEGIDELAKKGWISPETPIFAPISGTVVLRKVGPGQYVSSGSSDPVYVIGDLSTVWLIAYVRETEAPRVKVGQALNFTVLAFPNRVFNANVAYVATALDTNTRRLLVRAAIDNAEGLLKPEMFASVSIFTGEGDTSPSAPREAIIYEGDSAHVWVAHPDDKSVELRAIKPGLINGNAIQVLDGLHVGDSIVTRGSLFIDRAAVGS